MSSGNDSDGGAAADTASAAAAAAARVAAEKLTLPFPRVAKFPETVTKPNFYTGGLRDGRMYEEEVPLAKVRDWILFDALNTCIFDVHDALDTKLMFAETQNNESTVFHKND